MAAPFVRSPFNYDLDEASDASAYVETMVSLTVQSHSEDADLNVLMKRFGITGVMPQEARLPSYGDFSHITNYADAINAARDAEESFLSFPADIRALFENDPQRFLDYVENPANIEQVRKWFPREDLSARSFGSVAPSVSVAAPQGGGGIASRDGGAGVSQQSGESGAGQSAPANRSA